MQSIIDIRTLDNQSYRVVIFLEIHVNAKELWFDINQNANFEILQIMQQEKFVFNLRYPNTVPS